VFSPKPIAYWPLNGDDNLNDISGNNQHATLYGSVTLTTGVHGQENGAYEFPGTMDSYLKVVRTALLDVGLGGSFSYASYVYPTKPDMCFFEWTDSPFGPYIWILKFEVLVCLNDRSSSTTAAAIYRNTKFPLKQNSWNFVGVTYNYDTATFHFTVGDTTIAVKKTQVKAKTNVPFVYIGHRPSGFYSDKSAFMGKMACVMLWNKVLTEDEMKRVKQFCLDNARLASSRNSFLGCEY
jgi:hypothetical protein